MNTTYQNLFVSKIPDGMTDAELLAIFAPFGAEQAFIKGRQEENDGRASLVKRRRQRGTGPPQKSRFGFVVFGSEAQGMQAVAVLGQPSAQPNGSASTTPHGGTAPVRAIAMDLFPSRRTWKPAPRADIGVPPNGGIAPSPIGDHSQAHGCGLGKACAPPLSPRAPLSPHFNTSGASELALSSSLVGGAPPAAPLPLTPPGTPVSLPSAPFNINSHVRVLQSPPSVSASTAAENLLFLSPSQQQQSMIGGQVCFPRHHTTVRAGGRIAITLPGMIDHGEKKAKTINALPMWMSCGATSHITSHSLTSASENY